MRLCLDGVSNLRYLLFLADFAQLSQAEFLEHLLQVTGVNVFFWVGDGSFHAALLSIDFQHGFYSVHFNVEIRIPCLRVQVIIEPLLRDVGFELKLTVKNS